MRDRRPAPLVCLWWFLAALWLSLLEGTRGWQTSTARHRYGFSLVTIKEASFGYGGEPFGIQPQLQVYYDGVLNTTFDGYIYVELDQTPTGLETLWYGNSTTSPTHGQATVSGGIATFSGLYINEAGLYTIKYILMSRSGEGLAWLLSDLVTVKVGRPYRLGLMRYPGSATAGELFFPQPMVAVLDRGGNTVNWYSDGRIYGRALKLTSNSTASVLRPANGTSIAIERGEGTFLSLYIDDEGPAFKLIFTSSLTLEGGNYVESIPFAVITGTFAQIVLKQPISAVPVVSGQAFALQPEIQVQDKGGNIVKTDSTSKILVEIMNNPGHGRLVPEDKTFMPVIDGVTNFTLLSIDRTGQQYRLVFHLYSYQWKTKAYLDTGIKVLSEFFDVGLGPPAQLTVGQEFYEAERWAGGQPFRLPPVISLLDGGTNIVAYDSSSKVYVNMTSSPGFNRTIVISTTNDPIVNVTSVQSSHADGSYGVGEVIDIILVFSDDVLLDTGNGAHLPYLSLNLTSLASRNLSQGLPWTVSRTAWCNNTDGRWDRLTFLYEVEEDDYMEKLDYAAEHMQPIIHLNGASLVDLINRNASIHLPRPGSSMSLSAQRSITVDSTQPMLLTITTKHPGGEYGAGEVFDILVNYSRSVVVEGTPLLPVNATMSTSTMRYATYVGGSGGTTLVFRYVVEDGDDVPRLGVREDKSIVLPDYVAYNYYNQSMCRNGSFVVYNSSYNSSVPYAALNTSSLWYSHNVSYMNCSLVDKNYTTAFSDKILTASSQPKQAANLSLAYLWERIIDTRIISFDSSVPHVDPSVGVYSTSPNTNYSAGDRIYLHVNFTKPLSVRPGIRLLLKGEYDVMMADYIKGDGTNMLTFLYEVQPFDFTPALDTLPNDAFVFVDGGYIRRLATNPVADAIIDFNPKGDNTTTALFQGLSAAGTMLSNQSRLSINALPTMVRAVKLNTERTPDNMTYGVDDLIYIYVNFSTRVVVKGSPVLVLDVNYMREATYIGGNLTSTLHFAYQVQYGDKSSKLGFRYAPNALCVESGCGQPTSSYIRQFSSNPTYAANLRLPVRALSGTARRAGMPFCNVTIDTSLDTRETTVMSVNTSTAAGVYGVGELIEISVTFSDEVKLGFVVPSIMTTLGKAANFSTGEDSKTLNFFFEVTTSDPITRLDFQLVPGKDSAIICGSGCNITNFNGHAVNLSMINVPSIPVNVTINPRPSQVVDVYSTKNASSYDGIFTVGEVIDVVVVFDFPVTVVGVPLLILEMGFVDRAAAYQRDLSSSTELLFSYAVQDGDVSANLAYVDRHSLIVATANTGLILRESVKPMQQANVTLPWPIPLARHGAIRIDTRHVPQVMNVTCRNSSGTYAPGDTLVFDVHFSKTVAVTGKPVLHLDLTGRHGTAQYTHGSYSHVLSFSYTIRPGDKAADLSYVDHHSLERGYDTFGDFGTIRQVSQAPTVNALLYLPFPGEEGSLSYTSDIVVDGSTPFISGFDYMEADGTYGLGQLIHLKVVFTSLVSVQGQPLIHLDTGVVSRPALYHNGSGTNELLFRYQVHVGDRSESLDYRVLDLRSRSAVSSFDLNGGWIRRYSSQPILDADLHLNPPNAGLLGEKESTMYNGQAAFDGMWIEHRGMDYKLHFYSNLSGSVFQTAALVDIGASAEFELRHEGYEAGDLLGSSVDIHGDFIITGAPGRHRAIEEVQTIRTEGDMATVQREVQVIGTQLQRLSEIQSFETSASPYQAVGGYFYLSWGSQTTRAIEADITASALAKYLSEDLPGLGTITVKRSSNEFCACENAYNWTLTFVTYEGDVPLLQIDGSGLVGEAAAISDMTVLREASTLGGSFTLSYGNGSTARTTRDISFDASAASLSLIISQDLNIDVFGSYSEDASSTQDGSQGRTWFLTLNAIEDDYNIAPLVADYSKLTGYGAKVWTYTALEGKGPLTGSFRLSFEDETTWTAPIAYNASAEIVKAALEELPMIDLVSVSRSGPTGPRGYTWIVTFNRVNRKTDYGYVYDPVSGDLPAIKTQSMLKGTGARIWVGDKSGTQGTTTSIYPERAGSYGNDSGAVFIFKKHKAKWSQVAALQALDTGLFDLFGHDVSLQEGRAVVGAPGAADDGPQMYLLGCNATGGSFRLLYRGFESDPIPYNSTRQGFMEILNGPAWDPRLPTSFPTVSTLGWGSGGSARVCDNNTFNVILKTPVAGYFYRDRTELRHNASDLKGEIHINDTYSIVDGRRGSGNYPAGTRVGAAYVFRRLDDDSWVEEAKLVKSAGQGNDRLGWSVTQAGNYTVAGAPGDDEEMGAAFVFRKGMEGWQEDVKLTSAAWTRGEGDSFGYQVAMTDELIIVGAPGYNNSMGAVYVFWLDDGDWKASQQIVSPAGEAGDGFGCSVAVDDRRVAVGACGMTDFTIHLHRHMGRPQLSPSCGAVFYYEFDAIAHTLGLAQKLLASNLKTNDHLGFSLKLKNDTLLVSSMVRLSDPLRIRNAVQAITLTANPGQKPLGSRFQVAWRMEAVRGGGWQLRTSRYLTHNASEEEVRLALEEDLMTGKLTVTRSTIDSRTGGYTWTVTFREVEEVIESLQVISAELTGTNATGCVTVLNEPPRKRRGLVHVFRYYGEDLKWREEGYLYPMLKQKQDLFGFDVALDASTDRAVVGMPNRDTYFSGTNSGAIMLYDLRLFSLRFSEDDYTVSEGAASGGVSLRLDRWSSLDDAIPLKLRTVDRNADGDVQDYVRDLYDIDDVPEERTCTDMIGAGTATARAQFYGSYEVRSMWIGGAFDYRALADYLPTKADLFFDAGQVSMSYQINVTNDMILEAPDEDFLVTAYQPGIFPGPLGSLWRKVVIQDDGDGLPPSSLDPSYSKVGARDAESQDSFGSAVALLEAAGFMVVGAPYTTRANLSNVGAAYLFQRSVGSWEQVRQWAPPSAQARSDYFYGQAVALDQSEDRDDVTVLVGAPGAAKVYVHLYENGSWSDNVALLTSPDAFRPQHRFGGTNTVAISGDVAVVGAPGLEAIYIFERSWNVTVDVLSTDANGTTEYKITRTSHWRGPRLLRSSTYDYDIVQQGVPLVHRQEFGASVAVSGRTIAVGCPQGDYPKAGTEYVDLYRTDGEWHSGLARGQVYIFFKRPLVWAIRMKADVMPYGGSWQAMVIHRGVTCTTAPMSYRATAQAVKDRLQGCPNLDALEVTRQYLSFEPRGEGYRWDVTFLSDYEEDGKLQGGISILWNGEGVPDALVCTNCTTMTNTWLADESDTFEAFQVEAASDKWREQALLQPSDKGSGDRFGYNLALENEQLVVSALYSGAEDFTTWDFETGDLQGWTKTGTAFDHQPTYGDNPVYRAPASSPQSLHIAGHGQSTGLKGRYFIGTYEMRPGNGSGSYMEPNPRYPPGGIAGDELMGTLTSQPFLILGERISFLIGGGCDPFTEYMELLVDGYAVARATGRCTERMRNESWDTSVYMNRVGQIRIVDAGSSLWAHINVDEIRFSWDTRGGRFAGSGAKVTYSAPRASPRAGAAYCFWRRSAEIKTPCTGDRDMCIWEQQIRLGTSDRRSQHLFGYSLSLNDAEGVAVIGAINAMSTGLFKETLGIHPHDTNITRVPLPLSDSYESELQMDGTMSAADTGARAIWSVSRKVPEESRGIESKWAGQAGALYIYHRSPEVFTAQQELAFPVQWTPVEHLKIQPPDLFARDSFGFSAALSGYTLVVGATGQDAYARDGGAAYIFDLHVQRVRFTEPEYYALEGRDPWVELTVVRDQDFADVPMTVAYATSDLSAQGVDRVRFKECMLMNVKDRVGCGDYLQTAGQLLFATGEAAKRFIIYLMDDDCNEHYSKYAQVSLSIPGSSAILGEDYVAKIRIDDDDSSGSPCTTKYSSPAMS